MIANFFLILKDAPYKKITELVLSKQKLWYEGGTFDVDNLMKNAKAKYHNFVKDGLWNSKKTIKDIGKESEIVALTAKLDMLNRFLIETTILLIPIIIIIKQHQAGGTKTRLKENRLLSAKTTRNIIDANGIICYLHHMAQTIARKENLALPD